MKGGGARASPTSLHVQDVEVQCLGEYANLSSVPLMDASSTDVVRRVMADFPKLDLRHQKYG